MNKLTKRILSVFLAIAMIVTILPTVTTEAATKTQNLSLYVGETYTFYTIGFDSLTGSSNTKKTIATVKVDKSKKQYTLSAKKAGTTTISIKGKDYYGKSAVLKYKITVKKPSFTISTQSIDNGYALIKIKNNCKSTFDRIAINYTFKTPDGEVCAQNSTTVSRVIAGKTSYETVYVGRDANIDYTQSVVKVTGFDRDPSYTYKTVTTKQVTVKETEKSEDDTSVTFKLKEKNTLNQYVYGHVYVISYDAEDNIIDVDDRSLYLDKKETKTTSEYSVSKSEYSHPNYDHYEIVYQGYYSYKK